jgi:Tfp pilus assembly protein PilF
VDNFPADDLVWVVFYEPGTQPKPIAIIVGRGAQALADDFPQLFSILEQMGISERRLQTHSRHAEALLLHLPGEPPGNVAWHYSIARQMVLDLWDTATETHLRDRSIEPVESGWLSRLLLPGKKLASAQRHLRPCPETLLSGRFPASSQPPTVIDHARWLCAFGRYGRASALLEKHLEHSPDDGAAHASLGQMLSEFLKQPRRALEHLRQAADLIPDNPHVWNVLGITLGILDESIEACKAFKREASLTDEFGAWMNVAMTALESGDMGEARGAANRALLQDPQEPLLLFLLTVLSQRDHDEKEANRLLALAEQALRRIPSETRIQLESLLVVQEARASLRPLN